MKIGRFDVQLAFESTVYSSLHVTHVTLSITTKYSPC